MNIQVKFCLFFRCLVVIACCLFYVNNVVFGACGESQTVTSQIDQGDAEEVRTEIQMGAGDLTIMGGAEALMNAEFTFNVDKLEPRVEFSVTNSVGELKVKPSIRVRFGDLRGCLQPENRWDINLNNEVPMDLHVELGAGDAMLDLRDLTLTNLDIEFGAGDVDLDISGNDSLNSFTMEMGVGNVIMDLSDTSFAAFNFAFGAGDVDIDVSGNNSLNSFDMEMGFGDAVMDLRNTASLDDFKLEFGVGDIDIDFTGDRENDLMGSIEVGVGNVVLKFPNDIGVKVVPMRGIVPVNAPGFLRDGNAFVNDSFGQQGVDIIIEIAMGVGDISLELE